MVDVAEVEAVPALPVAPAPLPVPTHTAGGIALTMPQVQSDVDEFNSRTLAFTKIIGMLCGRIDQLNVQMAHVMQQLPPIHRRLCEHEHEIENLAFNLQGFESAVLPNVDVLPSTDTGLSVPAAPVPAPVMVSAAPDQVENPASTVGAADAAAGEAAVPAKTKETRDPEQAEAFLKSRKKAIGSNGFYVNHDSGDVGGNARPYTGCKEEVKSAVFRGENTIARKRWFWAIAQVKMIRNMKARGMTNMRVAPNLSVAARLDRMEYRLDQYPDPGPIYEAIAAIEPLKKRITCVEDEIPQIWREVNGLLYLKDEVRKHGELIEECQNKIEEQARKLLELQKRQDKFEEDQKKMKEEIRKIKTSIIELREEMNAKLIELKEELLNAIEEAIEELKAEAAQAEEFFREVSAFISEVQAAIVSNLDAKKISRGIGPREDTLAGLRMLHADGQKAIELVMQRDLEAPPTQELIDSMAVFGRHLGNVLSEDASYEEAGMDSPVWTPLKSMSDGKGEKTLVWYFEECIRLFGLAINASVQALPFQIEMDAKATKKAKELAEQFVVVDAKIDTKADQEWTEAELKLKSDIPPVVALGEKLASLRSELEAKNKEFNAKLGKAINETMARFNKVTEEIATKAEKELVKKEVDHLHDKLMEMHLEAAEKTRDLCITMTKDKVTRKELDEALKALAKLTTDAAAEMGGGGGGANGANGAGGGGGGGGGDDADVDVLLSVMPYRCLACNKPLKKVNEIKKYSSEQGFFPPSTAHAPNSLQILRPTTTPSIPSKGTHSAIHNRSSLFSASTTSLPMGQHHNVILDPVDKKRAATPSKPRSTDAPLTDTKTFASYPGFLPSDTRHSAQV
jgi:hypothetical protein